MSMHTGTGIEFRPHLIGNDDESDVTSPPLWKTGSTTTPTETTTVLDHDDVRRSLSSHRLEHHHHNHNPNQEHEYYYLDGIIHSPTSRAKAISRGQQELMEMVKTMPESAYELSLQDLVQSSSTTTVEAHELCYNQKRRNNDHRTSTTKRKKNTNKKVERLRKSTRMESTNNGSFLLKMFIPTSSLGYQKNKKKKSKSSIATPTTVTATGTRSKVSPRPPLVIEGETSIIEKDNWWRKKFSVSARESISNNGGSGRMDGRSSRSSSQGSSRSFSRNMGDFISGCWSTKTKRKKA